MKIITDIAILNQEINRAKLTNKIAFVPTMGALHAGHLHLIKAAKKEKNSVTVASIFINPKQFNNPKDLASYPDTFASDKEKLEKEKIDILFYPKAEDIYPKTMATKVAVSGNIAKVLCAASRKNHFDGVALIVCKLLNLVQADRVYFGKKDFQQLMIVKRMCEDLNINSTVIPVDTLRDEDNFAYSSRNMKLSKYEKQQTLKVLHIFHQLKIKLAQGENISESLSEAKEKISTIDQIKIDYLELRDVNNDLHFATTISPSSRLFIAFFAGEIRLIDNLAIA